MEKSYNTKLKKLKQDSEKPRNNKSSNENNFILLDVNQLLEVSLSNEKENQVKMTENNEFLVSSLFRIDTEKNSINLQVAEASLNNWVIENGAYVNKLTNMKTEDENLTSNSESALKQKLSYSLDKPHQCGICGNQFTRRDHLRRHEQAHTGMTPYECEDCGKCFNRKDRLKRHKLIHTAHYSYECDLCSKIFIRKDHLTTHRHTHIRDRSFLCSYCNKTFTRKDHLVSHKKSHGS